MPDRLKFNHADSKVISFLRFPLIAWVVFAHSVLSSPDKLMEIGAPLCAYLVDFITISVRVPIFFFISGYCFFLGVEVFNWHLYLGKLKRRVHSLLFPYLIWNCIVIICFALAHIFCGGIINENFENICNYSTVDFIRAFYDKSGGQPIAYQLWFLRDLMVISIMSPIVFFLVKHLKLYSILLLSFIYFADIHLPFRVALFYFSFGAFFSANGKSFTRYIKNFKHYGGLIIWVVISAFSLAYPQIGFLRKVCIVFYAITILLFANWLVERNCKMPKLLTDSNYFVYLWHGLPVQVVKFAILKIFLISTGLGYICGTFGVAIIIIVSAVIIYYLLNKFFPRITSVLVGRI